MAKKRTPEERINKACGQWRDAGAFEVELRLIAQACGLDPLNLGMGDVLAATERNSLLSEQWRQPGRSELAEPESRKEESNSPVPKAVSSRSEEKGS